MRFLYFFGLLFFVSFLTVSGQDGILDSSFGNNGTYIFQGVSSDSRATSASLFTDGSILVAQYSWNHKGSFIKLLGNGTLDPAFGASGVFTLPGSNLTNSVGIVQSGDKFISAYSTSSPHTIVVNRYSTNVQKDSTFGINGITSVSFGSSSVKVKDILIDSQNRIVIGFNQSTNGLGEFGVLRLTAEGFFDQTFGIDGKVTIPVGNLDMVLYDLDCDITGKIALAGNGLTLSGDNFVVVKLLEDGQLDTQFSGTGILIYNNSSRGSGTCVKYLSDGRLIVGGYKGNSYNGDFCLLRLLPDGQLDQSFGNGGSVLTSFTSSVDVAYALHIQNDGRIIAGGYGNIGSLNEANISDCALTRYFEDGTLDPTFGNGGKVFSRISNADEGVYLITSQPDNKFLAAGYAVANGIQKPMVLRYLIGAL